MIYFIHGKPFITTPHKSIDNYGIDVRAIKQRGEVKIKNEYGEYESLFKGKKLFLIS